MKKLTVLLGILMIMIFSIGNAKMTKEEKKFKRRPLAEQGRGPKLPGHGKQAFYSCQST